MNWNQLYTVATASEREELLIAMFQTIEARHQKIILVPLSINALLMGRGQGWGLLRNRRRRNIAHFIGDRRLLNLQRRIKNLRTAGLAMVSIGGWVTSIWLQPLHGAMLVILVDLALITILVIKPYLRWQPVET